MPFGMKVSAGIPWPGKSWATNASRSMAWAIARRSFGLLVGAALRRKVSQNTVRSGVLTRFCLRLESPATLAACAGCTAISSSEPALYFVKAAAPSFTTSKSIEVRVGLAPQSVSYTHLRAHETRHDLVCRLLLE